MSNFLSAAWGADTPTAPIWLMRQAGRYLPEYRKLKERYGFWRMCRTPEIAAEITLQPVRRFPLDAAILFNDIMTPLPPMGVDIEFDPGPVIRQPIRTPEAVRRLRVPAGDQVIDAAAVQLLHEGLGGAHIFNLGHGVLAATHPDAVARLVDTVHRFSRTADTATASAAGRGSMA